MKMASIATVAKAFAAGKSAKVSNASTDGVAYKLHNTVIALKVPGGVMLNWGGWYTPTTANHMNHVLTAMGINKRVGYASARDEGHREVFMECAK
jgi:hypothetical protein